MKTWRLLMVAGLAIFLLSAQSRNRLYDPAAETTVKGTVEKVSEPSRGRMSGIHLFVVVDGSTTEVALGPSAFVKSEGFSFAAGDAVEVTGSRVTTKATSYVIAREVAKDGKTLVLRDKDGTPKWAGPRGRRTRTR